MPEREKFLRRFEKGSKLEREERLFDHLKLLYSKAYLTQLKAELSLMTEKGMDEFYAKTVQGYLARLCSLEHFMKELKERFSRWFNRRHGRRGTLWQDRYRSVLVEDGEALRTMDAYIDLNPVRAGLVDDPKDYRWCGFAEALGGSKRARRAVGVILGMTVASWEASGREAKERLENKSALSTCLQPRHLRSDFFRVVHYTEKNPALVTSLPPAWKSRINSRAVPYRRILLGEGIEAGDEVKTTEERQGRSYRRRGMKRAEVFSLRDLKVQALE